MTNTNHPNLPLSECPSSQARSIQSMFNNIARRYDLLNRLLSLGIDVQWRKQCVRILQRKMRNEGLVLDLAAGTGDLALTFEKHSGGTTPVIAVDFSHEMLKILKEKTHRYSRISITTADGLFLPFKAKSFEGVMIGFGIRNFTKRPEALKELHRVLKDGGTLTILEFSIPRGRFLRTVYLFYFEKILPLIGGLFSRRSAYTYLPESVRQFPTPENFATLIREAGLKNVTILPLTGGIATLYSAEKLTGPSEKIPAV